MKHIRQISSKNWPLAGTDSNIPALAEKLPGDHFEMFGTQLLDARFINFYVLAQLEGIIYGQNVLLPYKHLCFEGEKCCSFTQAKEKR